MYQDTTMLGITMNVSCMNRHSWSWLGLLEAGSETRILVHRIYWGGALKRREEGKQDRARGES